jgi:hypothetical protein
MTSLAPPKVKEFPAESIEKQVYGIVESLIEYLPIMNDRNRLGFVLYKYMTGEGDPPMVSLKHAKLQIKGISLEDLAKIIEDKLTAVTK